MRRTPSTEWNILHYKLGYSNRQANENFCIRMTNPNKELHGTKIMGVCIDLGKSHLSMGTLMFNLQYQHKNRHYGVYYGGYGGIGGGGQGQDHPQDELKIDMTMLVWDKNGACRSMKRTRQALSIDVQQQQNLNRRFVLTYDINTLDGMEASKILAVLDFSQTHVRQQNQLSISFHNTNACGLYGSIVTPRHYEKGSKRSADALARATGGLQPNPFEDYQDY